MFVFPLIRRVFLPSMVRDIISVQPMSDPIGATFYLDEMRGFEGRFEGWEDRYPREPWATIRL